MAGLEEMTDPPTVPGTVHCAVCMAGYEPAPAQVLVLAGLGRVAGWRTVLVRYATRAGWYQRFDGLLLCPDDAGHGDGPVTPPAH